MKVPTQAAIIRHVKAVILAHKAAGLFVTATKVTFCEGIPSVEVTTGPDSSHARPVKTGGPNVQNFKKALEDRHAARRA